jgi:hypothetical protein
MASASTGDYDDCCLLALALVAWALVRSAVDRARSWSDADSWALKIAGAMAGVVAVSAFLDPCLSG